MKLGKCISHPPPFQHSSMTFNVAQWVNAALHYHQQTCETCRPTSQWPTFIMLHGCLPCKVSYKPPLLLPNMSSLITSWWESSVVVMVWYRDAFMPICVPGSVVWKTRGFIYFLFRFRLFTLSEFPLCLVSCWSQSHTFIGSLSCLLLCHLCQFVAFWVGGNILYEICLSTDPETSDSFNVVSAPQLFPTIAKEKQRWHWALHDETESMMGLHPALWGEWKNKLKRISNPIPNVDSIEWVLGTNGHLAYSQT